MELAGKAWVLRQALAVAGVDLLHDNPDLEAAGTRSRTAMIHTGTASFGVTLGDFFAG